MEKDNALKPDTSISTAATVVTLAILFGGLFYWYFAVDLSLDWESVRPVLIACSIFWIALVCLLALGFLGAQLWQICRIKKFATQGERDSRGEQKRKEQGL